MKVEMNFDGSVLALRLVVEDDTERAMAGLMESLTAATVSVERRQRSMYDSREQPIEVVQIRVRKPDPIVPCARCHDAEGCAKNGWCAYGKQV